VKLFAEMFTIAPGNKDHHVAVRCAVGVFVPLIILVLIDRMDLAIFASFGAFTGIYGRGELHRKRLFIQVRAGSLMLLVILLATLSARAGQSLGLSDAASTWSQMAATTVVAGACSLVIAWWRHRPAGSLFHIFAFAAIASIPHQPPLWQCMLASVLTTVFCLLVGISSRVARGIQRIIGTILGLILLAGVLLLNPAPWQTVLVIAVCQFGAEMFIARQYVLAQVFVRPLALSSTLLAAPAAPEVLLRDRIVETVIGAAVGIAVVVTPAVWRRLRAGIRAQRLAA
jgi:hypothetical protein